MTMLVIVSPPNSTKPVEKELYSPKKPRIAGTMPPPNNTLKGRITETARLCMRRGAILEIAANPAGKKEEINTG